MATDHHEIRSEIECKLLCLNRIFKFYMQQLLKFLSKESDIALKARVATPGKALSAILQHHKDIALKIEALSFKDNKRRFYSSAKMFRSDIDADKVDATVINQLLRKIPAYPTCTKNFIPIRHEDIIHQAACTNDSVCCSICMQCAQCCLGCEFSNIDIKEIQKLRNCDAHYTTKEFKEISDSIENQPTNLLAVEWERKFKTWRDILFEILALLSDKTFLDPNLCERDKLKVNNVLTFKKDVYLPCCFPNENIFPLIYRRNYVHSLVAKFDVSTKESEKLLTAKHLRSEKSVLLRQEFESGSKKILVDILNLNEADGIVDVFLNGFEYQITENRSADVKAIFRIDSKENDIIPKEYRNTTSNEVLEIIGGFEFKLIEVLAKHLQVSNLNVHCYGYTFSSINMYFCISGANTNSDRDAIKAELKAIVERNCFNDILDKCNLKECDITLTLPSDDEQKVLIIEFKIICYTKEVYQITDENMPLITGKIEENCRSIIGESVKHSQKTKVTTTKIAQPCVLESYYGDRIVVGKSVDGQNEDDEIYLEERSIYMYLVDRKISNSSSNPAKFSKVLVKKYFNFDQESLYLHKLRYPALDILCGLSKKIQNYDHLVSAVDEALDSCNMKNKKVTKEEVKEIIEENKDILSFYPDPLLHELEKFHLEPSFSGKDRLGIGRYLQHSLTTDNDNQHFNSSVEEKNVYVFDFIKNLRRAHMPYFIIIRVLVILEEFRLICMLQEDMSDKWRKEIGYVDFNFKEWFERKRSFWHSKNLTESKELTKELILASKTGNIGEIQRLLESNCDINAKDNDGATALMHASRSNNGLCVKRLLIHQCDVNAKDHDGLTALMHASRNDCSWSVQELLRVTCKVDSKDHEDLTALMHASRRDSRWCLEELLKNDCDVNAKDNEGLTALMHASRNDSWWCLEELLKEQSEVNMKDNRGLTALMHASRRGNLRCVQRLLQNSCDVNTKDKDGLTALMHASRSGCLWCIQELLKNNCDFNAKDKESLTALGHASRSGKTDCINIIKKHMKYLDGNSSD